MIEEIKNEIIDLTPLFGNKKGVCVLRKEVFEILDKYNNQPDYKSLYEELRFMVADDYFHRIKELEQKYNLGGDNK